MLETSIGRKLENSIHTRRPVDYGELFHESGMTLATDPRSDRHLNEIAENVSSKSLHHSKKEQKRKLKPQALRQAKARRQALKRKLKGAFFMGINP